jgi:hypothetical protein
MQALATIFYLYIIFNWLFFIGLCFKLDIFVVEELDLYEWNCGQESYKMHSLETKLGKYVLQTLQNRNIWANMSCNRSKVE